MNDDARDRLSYALAAACSLALVVSIAAVDVLPTHDGPHHVFHGHLENHLDAVAPGWLTPGHPVTSLGFHLLFALLDAWLPWQRALMVAHVAIALCWSWGFMLLCGRLRRLDLGLLGFATALSWPFYMGLYSYVLATGVGFWILALALAPEWTWKRRLAIGTALFLQAVMHAFPSQVTGLMLLLLVTCRERGWRERARELGLLAAMAVPTIAVALLASAGAGSSGMRAEMWLGAVDKLRTLAFMFVGGPAWRAWPLVLAAIAALVATALRKGPRKPEDLAFALGGGVLFMLAALTPFHLTGWDFFSTRFIACAVMFSLAALPAELWTGRARAGIAIGSACFALMAIGWSWSFHREVGERTRDALSGLGEPIQRRGPRLAVVLDPSAGLPDHEAWRDADLPFYKPLYNLGALYAVAQGGIPSWVFTTRPELHPFVFTEEGRRRYPAVHDPVTLPMLARDPAQRSDVLAFVAALGSHFEDVIFSGRADDVSAFLARGYSADFERGGFAIARFQGCPIAVRLPDAPAHPVIVQCGYSFAQPPSGSWLVPAGTAEPVVEATRCLCGDAWLLIALDRDDNGAPSPGDTFCRGSDERGMFTLAATERPEVRCVIQ